MCNCPLCPLSVDLYNITIYQCAFIISFRRFSNAKSTAENTYHGRFWAIFCAQVQNYVWTQASTIFKITQVLKIKFVLYKNKIKVVDGWLCTGLTFSLYDWQSDVSVTSLTTDLATRGRFRDFIKDIKLFYLLMVILRFRKEPWYFHLRFGKHSVCWKGTIKDVSGSCLSEIYAGYKIAKYRRNCSLLHWIFFRITN